MKIGKYLRSYGSNLAKLQKTAFLSKSNENLSEQKLLQLSECQNKLDDIHPKAHGDFVRSRRKWKEEGEHNSYFFCSEKPKLKNESIDAVKISVVNEYNVTAFFFFGR